MYANGILLIHGYDGSGEEVRSLADFLRSEGYHVSVPLLPGHGAGKEELRAANRKDWLSAVRTAYVKVMCNCRKVHVIGFSMGGLLAACLWDWEPDSITTINTPVRYWNLPRILHNLRKDFRGYGEKYWKAAWRKPIQSLLQFQLLLWSAKGMFRRITCRTLIIQAQDDDTVQIGSADYIFAQISAQEKTLCKIGRGGHNLLQSASASKVCAEVGAFLRQPEIPSVDKGTHA